MRAVLIKVKISSLPGRKARAKDPQHPKILGSRTKESPTPPVATSWRRGPTNPESYAPAQLVLEWHRIAEPVGSPRELCREGRRAPRKCLKPPKPQLKETTEFEERQNAPNFVLCLRTTHAACRIHTRVVQFHFSCGLRREAPAPDAKGGSFVFLW